MTQKLIKNSFGNLWGESWPVQCWPEIYTLNQKDYLKIWNLYGYSNICTCRHLRTRVILTPNLHSNSRGISLKICLTGTSWYNISEILPGPVPRLLSTFIFKLQTLEPLVLLPHPHSLHLVSRIPLILFSSFNASMSILAFLIKAITSYPSPYLSPDFLLHCIHYHTLSFCH
jgi:hypothetical protein